MFSDELIERAKAIYPAWSDLHENMEKGSPQVLAMLSEIDMTLDSTEVRSYAEAGRLDMILHACDRVDARKQLQSDCRMAYHEIIMNKA